jgi:hypothetical protein
MRIAHRDEPSGSSVVRVRSDGEGESVFRPGNRSERRPRVGRSVNAAFMLTPNYVRVRTAAREPSRIWELGAARAEQASRDPNEAPASRVENTPPREIATSR